MQNRDGTPTNAVYGISKLIDTIRSKYPEYILFAFDSPGKTFRHELYPDYKANREEAPSEFKEQIPLIFRLLEQHRIPLLAREGFEADDIIATVVSYIQKNNPDMNIYIASKDKDLYQLLNATTSLIDISSDSFFTVQDLEQKWGITPSQVKDFLMLTGDSSDNIPGIPGIGPKTASRLLKKYGSTEQIVQQLDTIKGKKKENITKNLANLAISEKLVALESAIPLDISLDGFRMQEPDTAGLFEFYSKMDFESLLKEMEVPAEKKTINGSSYVCASSTAEFLQMIEQIEKAGICSLDLETTGLDPLTHSITGISFSTKEGTGWFVPFPNISCGYASPLSDKTNMEKLREIIENPDIGKAGQNIKYDIKFLVHNGFKPAGYMFDTMIAAYLLQPGSSGSYGLTTLARQHLGYHMTELENIAEKDADGNLDLEHIKLDELSDYACEDADITFRLYTIFREKIEQDGCISLLENIEIPLASILAHMELKGVYADVSILKHMSAKTEKELSRITEEIYDIAEEEFNIHSPKQLSEILFDKLNLPPQKKTKTGFSTDESVLQRLSTMHILPAKILEVRHLAKLKNTYIDVLPGMVHPKTGRIHPEFNQVVTATGRLSSSNPNLQNIPVRRETDEPIRKAFMAEQEGHVLLAADYSQIELRMLAHFSGDTNLVRSFMEDRDIHAVTASLLHSVPVEDVTDRMRYEAKAVNFGIIYGQGPYGLARITNISHQEARTFIETYFKKFPGIRSFIESTVEQARECGEVRTILNRRRLIPEMQSSNKNTQRSAERIAVNTVIQGSAADLIKKAMVDIQEDLTKSDSRAFFILQIHDELIFELPEHEIEQVTQIVRSSMENAIQLSVPLTVHLEHGKTWKETK